MVDEYGEPYKVKPAQSDEPLSFKKLVQLIAGEGLPNRVRDSNFECEGDRQAAERLVAMVCVTSEFYPELWGYFEAEAQEWLVEKLRELGDEEEDCLEDDDEFEQEEVNDCCQRRVLDPFIVSELTHPGRPRPRLLDQPSLHPARSPATPIPENPQKTLDVGISPT